MTGPIIYLEDTLEDAVKVLNRVETVQYGESIELPDRSVEIVTKHFQRCNIAWVQDEEALIEHVLQGQAELVILDMIIDGSAKGWKIIEKLQYHRKERFPKVWILSSMGHFEKRLLETKGVEEFFGKDSAGMAKFQRRLKEFYSQESKDISKYITLRKEKYDLPFELEVSEIIYIETRQKDRGIGRAQERYVYILNESGRIEQIKLSSKGNLMAEILQQIEKRGIQDLVQVSKNVAINPRYIIGGEEDGENMLLHIEQGGIDGQTRIKATAKYLSEYKRKNGHKLVEKRLGWHNFANQSDASHGNDQMGQSGESLSDDS